MAKIELQSVSKVYPGGTRGVSDIDLAINDGEFMVLVGPSGCGKSTLLRMICGLEEITEGTLVIGDKDVTDLSPRERDIAMVFQSYALYPHMSVRGNLGYALRVARMDKAEIARRVEEVAALLDLTDLLERKPGALSGGQRQRVAMGRAIVREPAVYLMDEPLSNLDAKLRVTMRAELLKLHERLRTTTVYVTHDQVEAMTLGERVAVMSKGLLQQVDTPQNLYREPKNLFVAAFIGSPSMNLVEAVVSDAGVRFAGLTIPFAPGGVRPDDGPVVLGIRPEAFEVVELAAAGLPSIEVIPAVIEELGSDTNVIFPIDAPRVKSEQVRAAAQEGDDGSLLVDERASFTARIDPRASVRAGAPLRLAIDPAQIYCFDPASGENLAQKSAVSGVSPR